MRSNKVGLIREVIFIGLMKMRLGIFVSASGRNIIHLQLRKDMPEKVLFSAALGQTQWDQFCIMALCENDYILYHPLLVVHNFHVELAKSVTWHLHSTNEFTTMKFEKNCYICATKTVLSFNFRAIIYEGI